MNENRQVFISYSSKDQDFVNTFAALLQTFNLNVWKDSKSIPVGSNILKNVYGGIKSSSHFCCIISHSSVESAWVEDEISYFKMIQFKNPHLQIVPVIINYVEIPDYLKAYRCAHLEDRNLSPHNPEFVLILQALGVEVKFKDSHVITGEKRVILIENCVKLTDALGKLIEKYNVYIHLKQNEPKKFKESSIIDFSEPMEREKFFRYHTYKDYVRLDNRRIMNEERKVEEYKKKLYSTWKAVEKVSKKYAINTLIESIKQIVEEANLAEIEIWKDLKSKLHIVIQELEGFDSIDDKELLYHYTSNRDWIFDFKQAQNAINKFVVVVKSWEIFEVPEKQAQNIVENNVRLQKNNVDDKKENSIMSISKTKILFLGANPSKSSRLKLDEEMKKIQTNLKLAKERDQLILKQEWAVTIDTLMQAILDESPNIVHFSGHGQQEGIILQNEIGEPKIVSTEALASLFKLFKDTISCVILNSCYSESQAKAIKEHIAHVIGMKSGIPDRAAIVFSTGFYKAIGAGRDVSFAFELGKTAIQLDGIPEDEIPVLF